MTACAMTVGMVPMALALERGSQMQAPLGRAVIGGLVMSTFATLLVLPSIFALVIGRKVARSPSIYPDDPESRTTTRRSSSTRRRRPGHDDGDRPRRRRRPRRRIGDDDVLAFLRRILDEARSKRHDMVTHYTVDDLRSPSVRQAQVRRGIAWAPDRHARLIARVARRMQADLTADHAPESASDAPEDPVRTEIPDAPHRPCLEVLMRRCPWP